MANTAGPVFHVAVPHGPGVFWSLAVEEHFYLVWPWLVRILSRRILAMVCAALMVFEPVLRAVYAGRGVDIYPLSWFRFDALASGAPVGDLVSFLLRIQAAIAPARRCISSHHDRHYSGCVALRSALEDGGGISSSRHASDVDL